LNSLNLFSTPSYLEMLSASAAGFPPSIYSPPSDTASSAGGINFQVGNLSLNVGGNAGSGIYRTGSEIPSLQTEGLRDGVKNLMGRVKLPTLQ
jgi:vacuolar protein sorting-associated protein 45